MYSILKKKPNHRPSVHRTQTDQNERILSHGATLRRILAEVWTSTAPMPENQGGPNFLTIQS
jgi:hypothetical protein